MGSYYYLLAQLPFLSSTEQKPPMSSQSFIALAQSLVTEKDAALLQKLSLDFDNEGKPSGCVFVDKWQEWERTLRLNMAKHRALHLKRDAQAGGGEPPCVPQDAALAAAKAVNSDINPLEGEIAIDKARWNAIEEIAGNDYFSRNHVFAYFLKLLLLERRESFDTEKGFSEYKSLYAQIINEASLGE